MKGEASLLGMFFFKYRNTDFCISVFTPQLTATLTGKLELPECIPKLEIGSEEEAGAWEREMRGRSHG
jgi:hypothetical protein